MKPPEEMLIYNLFPLLCGPVSGWGPHLRRAVDMGFNWIFLNPIQQPGGSGSLYAVADYFRMNPAMVDSDGAPPEDQIRSMNTLAKDLGLKVMVDLVINHCATDSDLLREHPEWFQWVGPGRVAHPWALEDGKKVVWGDLAKFDHDHTSDFEGLCRYFLDVISWIIDLGFEGFRCDAAYQVPERMWRRIIGETIERHPRVRFFAETLGCTPQQTRRTARSGFDFIFNSAKWWDYEQPWLIQQQHLTQGFVPSVSFPESHDTSRLCEELDGNIAGIKQRYAFTALFAAGIMMPIGFEFGFRKKTHVVETTSEDWEETGIDLTAYIQAVNEIKKNHEIFQEEASVMILSDREDAVLILWKGARHSEQEALLILNKDLRKPRPFEAKLESLFQTDAPPVDISPGAPTQEVAEPFHAELDPGQVIVLVAG